MVKCLRKSSKNLQKYLHYSSPKWDYDISVSGTHHLMLNTCILEVQNIYSHQSRLKNMDTVTIQNIPEISRLLVRFGAAAPPQTGVIVRRKNEGIYPPLENDGLNAVWSLLFVVIFLPLDDTSCERLKLCCSARHTVGERQRRGWPKQSILSQVQNEILLIRNCWPTKTRPCCYVSGQLILGKVFQRPRSDGGLQWRRRCYRVYRFRGVPVISL